MLWLINASLESLSRTKNIILYLAIFKQTFRSENKSFMTKQHWKKTNLGNNVRCPRLNSRPEPILSSFRGFLSLASFSVLGSFRRQLGALALLFALKFLKTVSISKCQKLNCVTLKNERFKIRELNSDSDTEFKLWKGRTSLSKCDFFKIKSLKKTSAKYVATT